MGKALNKNTVVQNQNPKRARHDVKNPIFNKQSINIAYWNVHGLKQDNKINDPILNLTPENITQHFGIE